MHRSLCVEELADQRFTDSLQNLNQPEQALCQTLRGGCAWSKSGSATPGWRAFSTSWWPEAEAGKLREEKSAA